MYALTGSSFHVGLLGLVRVGPLLLLSLFGGVLADQADRRKVLLLSQSAMALVAMILYALTSAGEITVGALYAIVALNAVARAFEQPARQALVVTLVPKGDFPNAASLNGMAWRLSDVLGPILAGALIHSQSGSPALCYAVNFFSFATMLFAVWRMPSKKPDVERPESFRHVLQLIGEGIQFVNRTPVVRSAMWIDFWATLFSGADALLPAFAATILKVGPTEYGILAASTGVGAFIGAAITAYLPTVKKQGRIVVLMIGSYGLCTIAFGLSSSLWVAALSLAAVGASDMVSTVFRQTIRQLATPDELRGRMNATSSLFHISGPQLGDFEAGAVARFYGERVSIIVGGILCLIITAIWSRSKALTEYEHEV